MLKFSTEQIENLDNQYQFMVFDNIKTELKPYFEGEAPQICVVDDYERNFNNALRYAVENDIVSEQYLKQALIVLIPIFNKTRLTTEFDWVNTVLTEELPAKNRIQKLYRLIKVNRS